MPWKCEACSIEIPDDINACPSCNKQKSTWTIVEAQTRDLVISGARPKLEARVGKHGGTLPRDDAGNQDFETTLTEVCPSLAKAELLEILERGHLPAPAHRLVARLIPRRAKKRGLTLSVEFAQDDPEEHELDTGDREVNEDGFYEVVFQCVHGPEDVSEVELPGMTLIDLTEDTEDGLAPDVELSAFKRHVELPTEAVSDSVDTVELLEVEDISFHTGREILLPGGWSEPDAITGLSVVAAALDHARRNSGRRLLVAGHTDTVGSQASNLILSEARAQNVYLYLKGDKAGWAAHCQEHYEIADFQSIHKWLAYRLGWPTDPGSVDNQWGGNSKKARDAFRAKYNADYGGSIPDGKQSVADWEAFYDLYEEELAHKLKTEVGKLAEARAALQFTEPPILPCGEGWPTERPGADHSDDAADRRVDVLFFDASNLPALDGDPPGQTVYGGAYERDYLDVDAELTEPEPPPDSDAPFTEDCPIKPRHPVGDSAPTESEAVGAGA